jgi:hypothetical protein
VNFNKIQETNCMYRLFSLYRRWGTSLRETLENVFTANVIKFKIQFPKDVWNADDIFIHSYVNLNDTPFQLSFRTSNTNISTTVSQSRARSLCLRFQEMCRYYFISCRRVTVTFSLVFSYYLVPQPGKITWRKNYIFCLYFLLHILFNKTYETILWV